MSEQKRDKSPAIQLKPEQKLDEGQVVLPYNRAQFREFIKGLLGSPQVISNTINGGFAIEAHDLSNLHQLIMQRVSQQNDGILVQFRAKLVFSDNSTVELAGIQELLTYNEIRPVICRGIHLLWDFIMNFQDRETPEKQRIQVSIISSGDKLPAIDSVIEDHIRPKFDTRISEGFISFRIDHTARTWGADIEAMLKNHIESLLIKPHPIRDFIDKYNISGFFVMFAVLESIILLGIYFSFQQFSQNQLLHVNEIFLGKDLNDPIELEIAFTFLANYLAEGEWSTFVFQSVIFIIFFSLAALIASLITLEWARPYHQSFLLLTKKTYEEREDIIRKNNRDWILFIISIPVSIATSIIAGLLFNWFFT